MSPDREKRPTDVELGVISAARARRQQCRCGQAHEDGGVAPAVVARMRGYLAAHPGHQFAVDDEAGIVAVIIARDSAVPEVVAWAGDLPGLLDDIGAAPASGLS